MKIRVASLSHNKTGTHVSVTEIPLHAIILDRVGDWLAGVALHRVVCCPPGFLYNIHWGKPEVDPSTEDSEGDRWYPHNVAWYLHRVGTWMFTGFGTYRKERPLYDLPVTYAWVREHYPSWGFPFDGSCPECLGYQDIDPHEPQDVFCKHRQRLYREFADALNRRFSAQTNETLGSS